MSSVRRRRQRWRGRWASPGLRWVRSRPQPQKAGWREGTAVRIQYGRTSRQRRHEPSGQAAGHGVARPATVADSRRRHARCRKATAPQRAARPRPPGHCRSRWVTRCRASAGRRRLLHSHPSFGLQLRERYRDDRELLRGRLDVAKRALQEPGAQQPNRTDLYRLAAWAQWAAGNRTLRVVRADWMLALPSYRLLSTPSSCSEALRREVFARRLAASDPRPASGMRIAMIPRPGLDAEDRRARRGPLPQSKPSTPAPARRIGMAQCPGSGYQPASAVLKVIIGRPAMPPFAD